MSDFGARLRRARERRGLPLQAIADATKVSVAALEALERNDPSRLPRGIFSRAIVRSYAIQVGLNPDTTVHAFLTCFKMDPAPLTVAAEVAVRERGWNLRGKPRAPLVAIVVATVVLAVIVVYLVIAREQASASGPPDNARRTNRRLSVLLPRSPKLPLMP